MASSSSPPIANHEGGSSGIHNNRNNVVASATTFSTDDFSPSAIPTLKVMRLQAPRLSATTSPSSSGVILLSPTNHLNSTLVLPDSFGAIHVGETFTAYLGILNPSSDMPVRGLTVSSQLQTPTRRIVLPSRLDSAPTDIPPSSPALSSGLGGGGGGVGVDAIVSRQLDEAGPHILRVEVSYISNGQKSLRKFYRFNVSVPLRISELVTRNGDATCLVSITVENVMEKYPTPGGDSIITISSVGFHATSGLIAQQITLDDNNSTNNPIGQSPSALQLFDKCGRLKPGECYRYLFCIKVESEEAALRGIACGDDLGQAVLTYHKSMGEMGKVYSSAVICPPSAYLQQREDANTTTTGVMAAINPKFVVHGSGLSVDVAAASAQRSISGQRGNTADSNNLDDILPVTVEPIDPPSTMELSVPIKVPLLIVNHSNRPMNLQLQMRMSDMIGVVVCGPSYISLGEVPPSGGSCTMDVRFVALVAGFFAIQGCYIVDLVTGVELQQPALFNVFVTLPVEDAEEKKAGEN